MSRDLTVEQLKKAVTYDPETGLFFRLPRTDGDTPVNGMDTAGYLRINIGGKAYKLHLLAWLWMTGEWPKTLLDHENRIKSDNHWKNIRPADKAQNCQNASMRVDNGSGVKGVNWHKRSSRWHARVQCRGVRKYVGEFHSLDEAREFVNLARALLHGEFACAGGAN